MIYNMDAIDYLKSLDDGSIDLVLTDPPYDIRNTKAGGDNDFTKQLTSSQSDLSDHSLDKCQGIEWCKEIKRIQGGKINTYIWCNKQQIPTYFDYFVDQLKCSFDFIIWHKSNTPPTYHNKYLSDKEYCLYFRKSGYCMPENYQNASTIFNHPINQKDKKLYNHPTVKPLEIIRRLIRNSSKPGDRICDPFIGSGTTGAAAIMEDREITGCELNYDFYLTSLARITQAMIEIN